MGRLGCGSKDMRAEMDSNNIFPKFGMGWGGKCDLADNCAKD